MTIIESWVRDVLRRREGEGEGKREEGVKLKDVNAVKLEERERVRVCA